MADHKGIDADRAAVADFAQEECDVQLDATLTEGGPAPTTTSTTISGLITTTTVPGTSTTGG